MTCSLKYNLKYNINCNMMPGYHSLYSEIGRIYLSIIY